MEPYTLTLRDGSTVRLFRLPGIGSPIYSRRERVRGWNGPQSPFSAGGSSGARILRRRLRGWTAAEHKEAARRYELKRRRTRAAWAREADAACRETFGRPYEFTDYRISGIARDEFAPARKERLRALAIRESEYGSAADLHGRLARGNR